MIPTLLLLSLNFSNLVPKIDIPKIIETAKGNTAMEIAADSAFADKTTKFNLGQTIYVKVTADNDGQDKHDLNLRDNNYNLLSTYSMTKSGNQFLVNFSAPAASGIYSLEANIVSSGSVSNFVQTIEVGDAGSDNSKVEVKIENQVNTGNQVNTDGQVYGQTSGDQSPTLQVSPQPQEEQKTADQNFFTSFWQTILWFFKRIF